MIRNIFLSVISLTGLAILLGACNQPATGNHSAMDHNSMNHNSMNHNAAANANAPVNHGGMDHSEMKSSPNAANAPYDLQFIDTMVAHHQGAVEMAKMVEGRTARAELKAFAGKIIADQNREIEQMNQYRRRWYAANSAAVNMEMPGMADSMKMDMSRLAAAKDRDFDLMFIEMMIPHHAGAIAMSEEALARGEHAELKTLANSIIKEQQAEITQMKVWKSEWAK